jgi:hypothetical protein
MPMMNWSASSAKVRMDTKITPSTAASTMLAAGVPNRGWTAANGRKNSPSSAIA